MKLLAAIALLCASVATAQSPPGAPQPDIRTQGTVVLVPALVRNAKGELIFTFKGGDFQLTDDGIPQPLTLDEDTDHEPLALVVAVETGGEGAGRLDSYRNLATILGAVIGDVPHQVAVVAFDSTPQLVRDFTPDVDLAGEALNNLDPGDKGAAILDALKFSVDQLRRQPPSYRRAILLISETLDRDSQARMDDALRDLSDTNTAIYSLGFSTTKSHSAREAGHIMHDSTPGPAHGCMARDETNQDENPLAQAFDCLGLLVPPLRLAKIAAMATVDSLQRNVPETVAQLTGGEYFKFENRRTLVRHLLTLSNHVPNRYVLSFQPRSPHPGFHAVVLKLKDHPGLHILARSGYWVDEETAGATHP